MGPESYKQPEEKIPEELKKVKRVIDTFYEREKEYGANTAKNVTPIAESFKESFPDETLMLKRIEEISRIYKEKIDEERRKSPKEPEEYWRNMSMKYLFNKILTEEEKNNFKKFQELDIERRKKGKGKGLSIMINPNIEYSLRMLINNIPLSAVETEKPKTTKEKEKIKDEGLSESEKKELGQRDQEIIDLYMKGEKTVYEAWKSGKFSYDELTKAYDIGDRGSSIVYPGGWLNYITPEEWKKIKAELKEKEAEKEKSPEEALDEKRQELAKEYAGLKEKKLGIFGSERIEDEEESQRIALIENDYRESLKNYRKDLIEKNPENAKEILLKTVAEEANKFYDLKTEARLEAKGDSKIEKIKNTAGKIVEKYRKMPLKYKLLLSGGLFAGAIGAGALGGATGAALLTGMVAGRKVQRILAGAATAVGLEGLIKRSQEKKESKEVLKEFGSETLKLLEKDSAKLDKKLFDIEGAKKRRKVGRFTLAGAAGALVSSGAIGKAIGGIFGSGEVAETPPVAPETPEGVAETSEAEPGHQAVVDEEYSKRIEDFDKAQKGENPKVVEKFGKTPLAEMADKEIQSAVIEKGGNIWDSAKGLVEDSKEFSEAWKNSMVKVPGQDEAIHISKVNLVHPETTVEYVSGKGGGAGHFEIKAPTGQNLPDIESQKDFTETIEKIKNYQPPEELSVDKQVEQHFDKMLDEELKEAPKDSWERATEGGTYEDSLVSEPKNLFGADVLGENSGMIIREDGVQVIKNAYGQKGFDLLFTQDGKIGVDGPSEFNWGSSRGGFLGFGDRMPAETLNAETIQEAKKFIIESAKQLNELPEEE